MSGKPLTVLVRGFFAQRPHCRHRGWQTRPMTISVQPTWCLELPLQQQSVLLLAARGADGVPKVHPSKDVQRAYRGSVLVAAYLGRELRWGERCDTFMSLDRFGDEISWSNDLVTFFDNVDSLPHHFYLHLMHGAEILGYEHPDARFRERWINFYLRCCNDMHVERETSREMHNRLNDGERKQWKS